RSLDVGGSLAALLLFLPFFLIIPVFIKMTSTGPVLFKQRRLGKSGREFTVLKFRSMYVESDPKIHEKYTKDLIQRNTGNSDGTYKIKNDPRIFPFGHLLRVTSLDELPQLINVLRGDMSLVGPRPPIPYEFESYDLWHRRRLLEAKPGITGLWQVNGRNRVEFDEMVRLDLTYAQTWSPWLDLQILWRTPRAVVDGAH